MQSFLAYFSSGYLRTFQYELPPAEQLLRELSVQLHSTSGARLLELFLVHPQSHLLENFGEVPLFVAGH